MDIEKAWLSGFFKLDNADRRRALLESRPEYFQQYEREYMYLSDSLKNLGVVVTERTFSERFPDFTLEPHEEALSLFTKELENRRLYELSQNGIGAVIKALENGGTGHDVRREILKLSERLKTATMCESSDWLDDTEREEDYKRRRQMQSKIAKGERVGAYDPVLPTLRRSYFAHFPGKVITLIASPGVGKTWYSCYEGVQGIMQYIPTLLVSSEEDEKDLRDRCDALFLTSIGYGYSWDRFFRGSLTFKEVRTYAAGIEKLKKMAGSGMAKLSFYGIKENKFDVDAIGVFSDDVGADKVIIDGAHLLDAQGNTEVERSYVRSRAVKRMAVTHKKIVTQTLHMGEEAKKKGTALSKPLWCRGYQQDSDIMITLVGDRTIPTRTMTVEKARVGTYQSFNITFSMDPVELKERFSTSRFIDVDEMNG